MARSLHKVFGLLSALLIVVLTLSGTVLSAFPALEGARAPAQSESGLTVAALAGRVVASYPGVEQIRRAPSGLITAYYFDGNRPGAVVIDPATGQGAANYEPSTRQRWMTNLHRSLFLGDAGRLTAAAAAAALLTLSASGLVLTLRRVGGWRRVFTRLRGPLMGRLHVEVARVSVAGLLLSSTTALFMTASTFGLVPDDGRPPAFPAGMSRQVGATPGAMSLLQNTPVTALRGLTFPDPRDPTDVFTLTTAGGTGFLDQGTGVTLAWADHGPWRRLSETIYLLHTGQGAAWLGIILGLMALGAPVMAFTGVILWAQPRRGRPRMRSNVTAGQADTVLLVGSEGGGTWGFAATLHRELTDAGHQVHTTAMSRFAPASYRHAKRIILLAATYGDGVAPASAKGFLDRLAALPEAPAIPLAVVGFGDRQFPEFCGYANSVVRAAAEMGWSQLMPSATVDRQSPQDFARWGRALGQVLGHRLDLSHTPAAPCTRDLTLISRRDYGAEMQAPAAILRFALPHRGFFGRLAGRGFARFAAGDLLGIVPEGAVVPRYYSLASGLRDGFLEICVRKHPGGLCSGQLLGLASGDTVPGFIRRNPEFRPARNHRPVILIGAGTGIGPLAGFARANAPGRPMHLYFGTGHPDSDLFYGEEMREWQATGRLASIAIAFSRAAPRSWVQDALRADSDRLAHLIAEGAQVLVCGGRAMAKGVAETLTEILGPTGSTLTTLKADGRYVEDVY